MALLGYRKFKNVFNNKFKLAIFNLDFGLLPDCVLAGPKSVLVLRFAAKREASKKLQKNV